MKCHFAIDSIAAVYESVKPMRQRKFAILRSLGARAIDFR
jgi:hypothetical protein